MSSNPYLSIVITARNDNHGGHMLERMQMMLNGLFEQLEKYRLESEIILVDWNAPSDKPLLKEALKWPSHLKYCTIRVIEVSPRIHQRYKDHEKRAMHSAVAFNTGFRRARGQFILTGMIDLLYSEELMAFISQKKLKNDQRYRVNRCDIDRGILQYKSLKEQLKFAQKHIFTRNEHLPHNIKGFPELYTNGCGDFQLMSKHYWHLLRGYRKAGIVSAHLDGILSYASYAAGVEEIVLKQPMEIYHIDHDNKWTDKIKTHQSSFEKWVSSCRFLPRKLKSLILALYYKLGGRETELEVDGVAIPKNSEFVKICQEILSKKRSYIFNDENWGLGNEKLPESVINKADWNH